ncbi:hypothetical protein ACLK1S_22830 [Escherichia coli]
MFLKIQTDEGVVGRAAVIEGRAHGGSGSSRAGDYLIGQDRSRINDLWQVMYRAGFYRGGRILMSAIARSTGVMGYQRQSAECAGRELTAAWFAQTKAYSWVGGDCPANVIDGSKSLREIGSTPSN